MYIRKHYFLGSCVLVFILIIWCFVFGKFRPYSRFEESPALRSKSAAQLTNKNEVVQILAYDFQEGSLRGCFLPTIDPFDSSMKEHIDLRYNKYSRIKCNREHKVVTSFNDGKISVNDDSLYCWGRCFRAGDLNHGNNIEDEWSPVKKSVYHCEFVEVTCSKTDNILSVDYTMLHSQLITKSERAAKTDRKQLHSSLKNGKPYNVFVFLLDSVSTAASERYLQRTLRFMEKSMEAVQFPHINRVGSNTLSNILALYYGKSVEPVEKGAMGVGTESPDWDWQEACERYHDNETSIFDQYKEYGYTTLLTDDWPEPIFNYTNCKGIRKSPVDHTMDPFIVQSYKKNHRENFDGTNCLFVHQNSLEYTQLLINAYPDQPLFAWNNMRRITHDSQSGGLIVDEDLVEYMFENKELFDNSFVIFMSDLGCRSCSITTTEAGRRELSNPFFTMSVPKDMRTADILGVMRENAAQLQTHFDTRATLLDILKYQPKGYNLDREYLKMEDERGSSFLRKQTRERSCHSLPIPFTYCICHYPMEPLEKNLTEVVEAGKAVIDTANKRLKDAGLESKCNLWTFSHVDSVEGFAPANKTGAMKIIVAASGPNEKARFETTLHRSPNGTVAVGTIDRIDHYISRGECALGPLEAVCDCML